MRRHAAILRRAGVDVTYSRMTLSSPITVRGRLAVVLAVLRNLADRCELEHAVALSDRVRAAMTTCGPIDGAVADRDPGADDRVRADLDVGAELGVGGDDRA